MQKRAGLYGLARFLYARRWGTPCKVLFIEIKADPYTAPRLAGDDLEICELADGTREELFQICLRDIADLLAVIINSDGGFPLVVVCIIGKVIELAVLLDFAENVLTISAYAVVVVKRHSDVLEGNIVAICIEPLSALFAVLGNLRTNDLASLTLRAFGLSPGGERGLLLLTSLFELTPLERPIYPNTDTDGVENNE